MYTMMKRHAKVHVITLVVVLFLPLFLASNVSGQGESLGRDEVDEIVKSGNGEVLAVNYRNESSTIVDFFDAETGTLLHTVDLSFAPFLMALNPTGDRLVWYRNDGQTAIYNTVDGTNTPLVPTGPANVSSIKWSPVGNLVGITFGNFVAFHDADTSDFVGATGGAASGVVDFAWTPNEQNLATSHYVTRSSLSGDSTVIRTVVIWQGAVEATPSVVLEDRGGGPIAWSPDNSLLAVSEPGGVLIFNAATQAIEHTILLTPDRLSNFAWSPSGDYLATGGNALRIWNTSTWDLHQTIATAGGVSSLEWSSDGAGIFHNGGPDGLSFDPALSLSTETPTTPTNTVSATDVATSMPTITATSTPSDTPMAQPTSTDTLAATDTAIATLVPTDTPTATDTVMPTATATVSTTCAGLVQEAESATLAGNFVAVSDASASGGQYIHVPGSVSSNYSGTSSSTATFCFGITTPGTYTLKGWLASEDGSSNSFYVEQGGQVFTWDFTVSTVLTERTFPTSFTLAPGDQNFVIRHRESPTGATWYQVWVGVTGETV
ncbi:MAG: hypothetical protein OHK0046_00150 [Anaerolineae bacterium]